MYQTLVPFESAANYTNNESAARYIGNDRHMIALLIFKVSQIEIESAAGESAANYTEVRDLK